MKLSKTETKKIRKTLGYNYTNYILNVLNERGIKNRLGVSHQPTYITLVFHGLRYNPDVIDAILEAYRRKQLEDEKRSEVKSTILP